MKIEPSLVDEAVLSELGARLARLRIDANLSQARLAADAGVSKRTVERLEAGHSTQLTNLLRVLRALGVLERLDAVFPEPLPSPVQRLRLEGRTRERASPATKRAKRADAWTWADD